MNVEKVLKFFSYNLAKGIVGVGMLWFFADYLMLPLPHIVIYGLLYTGWVVVGFFVYDRKIFNDNNKLEMLCKIGEVTGRGCYKYVHN